MIKLAIASVLGVGLLAGILSQFTILEPKPLTSETKEVSIAAEVVVPATPILSSSLDFKLFPTEKTITLEAANTVIFRGPVTSSSVSEVMAKIEALRFELNESQPIYLIMDTPGGSVYAGLDLIDYLKALPNKIQTVTLFAASMGFQIVQNSDRRFITENGTLMSHRASGGLEGQFDGEIETNYRRVKRKVDYMDLIASQRMGMSITDYKAMIKDEYWVSGFDSVQEKAADEKVNLRCGKSLNKTEQVSLETMFGSIEVKFSSCPIIRGPLKVDVSKVAPTDQVEALLLVEKALKQQREFVKDIVLKNLTDKYFK